MAWLGSNYIKSAFNKPKLQHIVKSFGKAIEDKVFGEFDGLACIGTSGLAVAPILAYEFDKHLMVVRKENDASHKESSIESHDSIKRYIIIDDFVSSGRTLDTIIKGVEKVFQYWGKDNPIYSGAFFWHTCSGTVCMKEMCCYRDNFEELVKGKVFAQVNEEKKYPDDGDKLYCIDNFDYDGYMIRNTKEVTV